MESERREHDTFTMSRLSNVNFSSLLTTSKFARLKDFLLHAYRVVKALRYMMLGSDHPTIQ
jgi:hypothetical protein